VSAPAYRYQSPLHRVKLSNHLQLSWQPDLLRGINPLFIGSSFPTAQEGQQLTTGEATYQSPLHRVKLSNLTSSRPTSEHRRYQSPLHRVKLSNSGSFLSEAAWIYVSIPSSSGQAFQQGKPIPTPNWW